jgi:hypothetical protein
MTATSGRKERRGVEHATLQSRPGLGLIETFSMSPEASFHVPDRPKEGPVRGK